MASLLVGSLLFVVISLVFLMCGWKRRVRVADEHPGT